MSDSKLYKLKPEGTSYNAAYQMQQGIRDAMRDLQRNLPSDFSREHLMQKVEEALSKLDNAVVDKTGLSSPVVQVKNDVQSHPRAYSHTPKIFVTQFKPRGAPDNSDKGKHDLYMYCPVGYNGEHFTPDDARLIDDPKEEQVIGNMLFAGGHTQPAELYSPKQHGVETPQDYQPIMEQGQYIGHEKLCFIAQGATLDIVEDYEQRLQEFRAHAEKVLGEISRIVNEELSDTLLSQTGEGEGFYINTRYNMRENEQGEIEFHISPRRNGQDHTINAGQPLELQDNDFFTVEEGTGEYRVIPNTETKQGRGLSALMSAMPASPHFSDYPELVADLPFTPTNADRLLGTNGHVPRLDEFEGHKILIYSTDDEESCDFTPPDAVYLPATIINWLREDRGDMEMGVAPPPQPEELKQEIMELNTEIEGQNALEHDGANLSYDP